MRSVAVWGVVGWEGFGVGYLVEGVDEGYGMLGKDGRCGDR